MQSIVSPQMQENSALFDEIESQRLGFVPEVPDGWVRIMEATHGKLRAMGSKAHAGKCQQIAQNLGQTSILVDGLWWCSEATADKVAEILYENM